MKLFKKKNLSIFSPADGRVKRIAEVDDPVFSAKMMGDGFAVEPGNSTIFSPVEGVVTSVFPTKHAIGLRTKQDLEVLVHIGIDTVDLNGEGFTVFVNENQKVDEQTKLAEINFDFLREKGKGTDVIVVFTNLGSKVMTVATGEHQHSQTIGTVE